MTIKYSGKQVIKAGENLISDKVLLESMAFDAAFDVLSYWRFSHEIALENAFSILQEVSYQKDKKAIFAKRLKRYVSIVKKTSTISRYETKKHARYWRMSSDSF